MEELIFRKMPSSYEIDIELGEAKSRVKLDTGSPITTISIPNLLHITAEPIFAFRKKLESFLAEHEPLSFGVYGSQMSEVSHDFIPYVVSDVKIGSLKFPHFMFWVDITYYKEKKIIPTSILFGFDYIRQGRKFFDTEDNFHIVFEHLYADTLSVEYALSNVADHANKISHLMELI